MRMMDDVDGGGWNYMRDGGWIGEAALSKVGRFDANEELKTGFQSEKTDEL